MTSLFLPVHLLALSLLVFQVRGSLAKTCQDKCGNLTIPYPFGIGKGCFFAEDFELTCNSTSGKAFFFGTRAEVYRISDTNFSIIGHSLVFSYNGSSGKSSFNGPLEDEYLGDHFSFSHTSNKFVAIGCDVYAYVLDAKSKELLAGCAALCSSSDITSPSTSCSGIRCCQAPLSKDLTYAKAWMQTMNTMSKSWSSESCGYLILAAKDFSDYNKFDLSKCDENYEVPMVIDWSIGNLTCQEAKKREDHACQANSDCVNSSRGVGYLCRCSPGYEGNPYLPNGCKDIDECKSAKRNNCPNNALCHNTPGGYLCLPDRKTHIKVLFISLGIGISVGVLTIIVMVILLFHKLKKRKYETQKKKFFKRNGGLLLQQQIFSSKGSILETKIFTIEELDNATNNFNATRVLGKGGLGTVYKGMLSNGSIVAVKKSNKIDEDQIGQFINEVSILSQINHRHIVKLLGCCLETEVPLLVYEYVSNGTLSNHLHDEPNVSTISWENRLRIAAETAGALSYMHSHACTAIFHRDVKSSNILLDDNFRAIISDFGISRSVPVDQSHLTTLVRGTPGYVDPDYFMTGQLNDKSDVYAFGVVLAELLTGQKAVSSDSSSEGLVMQFRSSMEENRLFNILERRVASEGQEEEINTVAKLAKKCLKINARKRPGMKEVAAELDRLRNASKRSKEEKSIHDYDCCSFSERSLSCKIE